MITKNFFYNQEVPSEYHSKFGSNTKNLHENTQGLHTEDCTKSFKTKNHVTIQVLFTMKFIYF